MTIFGWDASHYDWGRGSMDIAAAVRDGIAFMTHKIGEAGSFTDDRYDDFYARAKAARVPLLGAYYVNHPGDQISQADRFISLLDRLAPGWRDGPFILQVDAEKFSYMERAPSLAELRVFCERLVERTSGRFRPIVYAPKWVYGDTLRGLGFPLWASSYGSNSAVGYRSAYPGDSSTRWAAYSGQVPAILQFGSRAVIGAQNTCDANAFRGSLAQLAALTRGDVVDAEDIKTLKSAIWYSHLEQDDPDGDSAGTVLLTLREDLATIEGKLDGITAPEWSDAQLDAVAERVASRLGDSFAERVADKLAARLAS